MSTSFYSLLFILGPLSICMPGEKIGFIQIHTDNLPKSTQQAARNISKVIKESKKEGSLTRHFQILKPALPYNGEISIPSITMGISKIGLKYWNSLNAFSKCIIPEYVFRPRCKAFCLPISHNIFANPMVGVISVPK